MPAITHLFEESVKKYAHNPYLWEKKGESYLPLSYAETQKFVYQFAAGLMQLGIEKGDRIALLSEGRNEWVISELGILYTGAINVPLSVKLSEADELLFRLEHSGARMVIASQYQARKLKPLLKRLPSVEKLIIIDLNEEPDNKEIAFNSVLQLGNGFLNTGMAEFQQRWQSVAPSDYANICYTSGTTADPKGIILSHRNYTANVEQALSIMDVPPYYVSLLILPWDHSFAHTAGIYCVMKAGASIASVQPGKTPMDTLKNIPVNIKETRPHFILSVPALAKNFKKNIESGVAAKGKIAESLFNFGIRVAHIYNGNGFNKGKGLRILLKPVYALIDKLLFSKIRANFGGRIDFFVGGGALLEISLQKFFYAIGMPMLQGYGLSEAAPIISANSLKKHLLGSSGQIVKNLEIKICDENGNALPVGQKGEIVIKGENVMAGYWRNDEATAQSLKNGWLYTGDLGFLDNEGYLYVLGRSKSLLIADDGEKYSPEGIEEAIVGNSTLISQCMLYNNQKPYTVALVVPNKEALKRYIKEKQQNHHINDIATFALKQIEVEINEYRSGKRYAHLFPQRWLPVAVAVIDEAFSEENQLLNSTMKLVRGKVTEFYAERITFLYSIQAKDICNTANRQAIERLLKTN